MVLIHGIRTQAFWQGAVGGILRREAGFRVIPIKYGFFDIFKFLFPVWTREGPVRRVVRELVDVRAKYPNAHISIIAHSFGTYAFANALREPGLRFHRVILCGCIIPRGFRVAEFEHRLGPEPIRNDCGLRDIWPVFAECITWGYGATGTFGFGTTGIEDRYHDWGYSDFFADAFVRSFWVPFLRSGAIEDPSPASTPPYWISLLAWAPLKWIIWGGAILAVGRGIGQLSSG